MSEIIIMIIKIAIAFLIGIGLGYSLFKNKKKEPVKELEDDEVIEFDNEEDKEDEIKLPWKEVWIQKGLW